MERPTFDPFTVDVAGPGMAVAYPGLNDGPTFRWSEPSALFRP
jgi:hypothetical protein